MQLFQNVKLQPQSVQIGIPTPCPPPSSSSSGSGSSTFRRTFSNLILEEQKLQRRRDTANARRELARSRRTSSRGNSRSSSRSRSRSFKGSRHRVSAADADVDLKKSKSNCNSKSKTFSSSSFVPSGHFVNCSRTKKEEMLLDQYKNKLALYVVDELRAAVSSRESVFYDSDSDSEVGLSIDEDVEHDVEKNETLMRHGKGEGSSEGSRSSSEDLEGKLKETTEIVRSLFYQVSSKVPQDICRQLRFKSDVYFYELLSMHFGNQTLLNFVEHSLLQKCKKLYSIDTFPALFSMLFYRYHLKFDDISKPEWLIRFNIFLKGANQIMWHDVNQQTRRLFSLFSYVRAKMKTHLTDSVVKEQRENLISVLCKFYYYYCSSKPAQVQKFLADLDISLDIFILNCLSTVSSKEDVIVAPKNQPSTSKMRTHYLMALSKLKQLPEFEKLESTTINKLQSTLNSMSLLGGPIHYCSEVRQAAKNCLNVLFPSARWSRSFINNIFQLSRPEYYRAEAENLFMLATNVMTVYTPLGYLTRKIR